MAAYELSVLEKQALGERVGDETEPRKRVTHWHTDRNHRTKVIDWQLRLSDTRVKLRRLYPKLQLYCVEPLELIPKPDWGGEVVLSAAGFSGVSWLRAG